MALNGKRGRYLATVALGEVGLGLSYAVEVTPSRAALFSWLPISIRTVGFAILAVGILVGVAALKSHSNWWDTIGWMAGVSAPLALLVLWCAAAVEGFLDHDANTPGWTPWASALVYACLAALVWQASDWPNPVRIIRSDEGEKR